MNKEPKRKRHAIIKADERGLQLETMDKIWRFSVACANSKEFKDIETPEQAFVRIEAGLELGLTPIWSLTNIMVVNGRPSVWGDALLGLVLNHPDCEDVVETTENEGTDKETAVCEVRRRGRVPVIRKFSVADVKRAGLDRKHQSVHGPYPQRMRQMRARSWACRDAFADVLRGLSVIEEMRDAQVVQKREAKIEPKMVLPDEVDDVIKNPSGEPGPEREAASSNSQPGLSSPDSTPVPGQDNDELLL
jgi:hypothetical protein